ncbi:MAG TPA: hypothetical protein VHI54_04240 [Actinomycetota bacterium]|nr:hypothetical protein [Actinomycetota bacterium]
MAPRRVAVLIVAALVAGSCTGAPDTRTGRSPSPAGRSPSPQASPRANPADDRAPCRRPKNEKTKPKPLKKRPLPPVLREVAQEVQDIRGLRFRRPINPRAVSREEMNRLLGEGVDEGLPRGRARRLQRAWATIGAIPRGTDLREAFKDFGASSIVGFYDTDDQRLVYVGTESPSPLQRTVLAHELTHALDDQHFNLDRLDDLDAKCRDEAGMAYLSLVEGSAEVISGTWASENLTAGEFADMQAEQAAQGGLPSTVPPFFLQMIIFPYPNGTAFVSEVVDRGGTKALNTAFRNPPLSTEQILHPEKYPEDRPRAIDVPDVASKLGAKWKDLEFEEVGEGWLHILLDLRIGPEQSEQASEGWDGGEYRAWSRGKDTAIILDTVWDSEEDAEQFAEAMDDWLGERVGDVLPPQGSRVRVLFASDKPTLTLLRRAAASSPVD